jgi:DNA-binding transcriptional regulator YhcF (GntR family)
MVAAESKEIDKKAKKMIEKILCEVQNEILSLGFSLNQTKGIMRNILKKLGLDY